MVAPALLDRGDGTLLTWADLDALAEKEAEALSGAGAGRGDRVPIIEPAGARFAVVLHACMRLGASAVPMSPRSTEDERARLLAAARSLPAVDGEVCVIFTSGTTGEPKPIPLTLDNHRASAAGCMESVGEREGDSWLLMLAPHHVGGFAILMRSLFFRQPVICVPRFAEDAVIAALEEESPTLVSAVPSMLTRLLDAGAAGLLRRPRAVLVGGAPATDEQVGEWCDLGLNVCPTYGMTETCSQVATVPPGRARELLGTAGFVHGHASIAFENGAMVVGGPVVSPIFGGRIVTGDLGHLDERGALVISGRADDVIITGGENVHPTEVERVLRAHPAVREVAIVGRPDRVYGSVLEAVVVADGVSSEAMIAWARERLPGFKVPRRVRFVEGLPVTEGGKLRRREI